MGASMSSFDIVPSTCPGHTQAHTHTFADGATPPGRRALDARPQQQNFGHITRISNLALLALLISTLVLLFTFMYTTIVFAQAPILNPDEAIAFDYLDAEYTASSVLRFEVQWDNNAWALATTEPRVLTPGTTTYVVIPPFTNGTHTVAFRACNITGCGGSSAPFLFAYAASSVPTAVPSNIRVIKR